MLFDRDTVALITVSLWCSVRVGKVLWTAEEEAPIKGLCIRFFVEKLLSFYCSD